MNNNTHTEELENGETAAPPEPPQQTAPHGVSEPKPGLIFTEVEDEGELTKLHPNYKLLMRFAAIILAVVIIIGGLVIEAVISDNTNLPVGFVIGPAVLLALFVAIRVPLARYNAKGYQISQDRLRVVRGIMFRSDTVVPFGRVQHIDVDQGPIERALDIATLTLHTAGSHNSSVHLPGLGHSLAVEMREAIRSHIKRETM
ncbi:MAG: PH domain-containing protein [Pseudomonadota bacterium]